MKPVTEQEKTLAAVAFQGFFSILKTVLFCLLVATAVLLASQSTVAPVNARLLGKYAIECVTSKIQPHRQTAPKFYTVNLEKETR